ncbi:Outer spore wall protein RRT8 [Erysiphe necator]|nr:Outer spore wall protein RRT8 [Erysiphe necator]
MENRTDRDLSEYDQIRYAIRSGIFKFPIKVSTICLKLKSSATISIFFQGIVYFLANRTLWKLFLLQIIPFFTISYVVIFFMFFFTYFPQLTILTFVNGPLAFLSTFVLILNESSFLITLIYRSFLQNSLAQTFDAVLAANKQTHLLSGRRELKVGYFNDPVTKLGALIRLPIGVLSSETLAGYLSFLPLALIPIFGVYIFIGVQAQARGCIVHNRYFQLKNWNRSEVNEWIYQKAAQYIMFGLVASALEMVPFVSIFFTFTNTVGAALWAVDIEHQQLKNKK